MWPAIIGGIGSVVSGILGRQGAKDQNAAAEAAAQRNIELQREFAQNGISWKVADAKRAGIHPLYALGASTTSFSPVSVGSVNEAAPMADMAKNLGQDLGRAVHATRTASQRADAAALTAIQMEGLQLDNEIKRTDLASRVARLRQQTNPPMPTSVGDVNPAKPFTVGEDKMEGNPPMMIGSERVPEDHGWSPAKSASDRWGDESFATNMYGNLRALRDLYHLYGWPMWKRRADDMAATQAWTRKHLSPNTNPRYRGYSNR